jgi:hypothetical protein
MLVFMFYIHDSLPQSTGNVDNPAGYVETFFFA